MFYTYPIRAFKLRGRRLQPFRLAGAVILLLLMFPFITIAQTLTLPLKPRTEEYVFNEIRLPGVNLSVIF